MTQYDCCIINQIFRMSTNQSQTQKRNNVLNTRLKLKQSLKQSLKQTLKSTKIPNINYQQQSLQNQLLDSTSKNNIPSSIQNKDHPASFEDEFDLKEKLGVGSQSIVHRCISKRTGKSFAVKTIKKSDEDTLEKAKKSYLLLQELNHDNILKVEKLYEGSSNTKCKIVTEYLECNDLRHYLATLKAEKKNALQVQLIHILRKIISALDYLKKRKVCHGDIKPENILYSPQKGTLKIIDFETSHQQVNSQEQMDLWSNSGSIYYRAPESLGGGYDERVDMWAVGVIAYEMLAGKVPFFSKYEGETRNLIKQGKIDPAIIQTSSSMMDFLKRVLDTNREKRITPTLALNHEIFNRENKEQGVTTKADSCSSGIDVEVFQEVSEQELSPTRFKIQKLFDSKLRKSANC